MSGSAAGKFQDHYSVLAVDPRAGSDVIQAAYAKLAQRYHPDNPETGDFDKFESLNLAYEVLTDPELRRQFDKLKGLDQEGAVKFTGAPFFEDLMRGMDLRTALLCILLDRRRTRPFAPSLSMRQLEGMLEATSEDLIFTLWYLKQRGLVMMDDKSSLQITVEGLDLLETLRPTADKILPLIKVEALAQKSAGKKSSTSAAGSVLNALNNAIARR
jgi:hypothetical protein